MKECEQLQRDKVISEVRSWVSTPYHCQGDIKYSGVDCGMLLVRVFVDTGIFAPFDPRPYTDDWYMHRSEEKYLGYVFERTKEVKSPLPGDIMVFRFGRCYAHGAIVTRTTPLMIVHAYQPARCVLEEDVHSNMILSDPIRRPKIFSFWSSE